MPALRLHECSVDLERGLVRLDRGEERWLTSLELALLRYLTQRPGLDVAREELIQEIWRGVGAGRVVDFAVGRLRKKLGEPRRPRHVLTAHGHGYRFVPLTVEPLPQPSTSEIVVALPTGELHLGQRQFLRDGQAIPLTRLEAQLLESLVAALGRPVPRSTLIARVWGRGRHERTLDAAIARLRTKLERDPAAPAVLVTVKGVGPRLVPSAEIRGSPPAGSFVDRPERSLLLATLERSQLVTALGAAGIGKTRLALEVGKAWLSAHPSAEVWFCDLSRVASADGLVARVSAALGAEVVHDRSQVGRMLAALPQQSVVVLDNFEQLVDGGTEIVASWLRQEEPRLLVTSRVPLGLPGEACVPLEPLAVASGVRLFQQRAQRQHDERAVRALVERLDGLPLAIELAAAIAHRIPPEAVLERIGARLDLLVVRPEGAVSQHSTLRAALDWSWHLLDDEQRGALAACSVFWAPFDEAAARAVVGAQAAPLLASLVLCSLVRRQQDRWTLFESVRDFARERLLLAGAQPDALERHAEHFAACAEPLAEDLGGPWGTEARVRLHELREDLFAALEATRSPSLRGRIGRILSTRGFLDEDPSLHVRLARAIERGASALHEPYLWLALASCSRRRGLLERAESEIGRVEPGSSPDPELAVAIGMERVMLALARGEFGLALDWLERVEQLLSSQPPSERRFCLQAEVAVLRLPALGGLLRLDEWERAAAVGLQQAEETGNAHLLGMALRSVARLRGSRGQLEQAVEHCDRAIALAQRTGRVVDELLARSAKVVNDFSRGAFLSAEEGLAVLQSLGRAVGRAHEYDVAIVRCWMAFERRDFEGVLAVLPVEAPPSNFEGYLRLFRAAALCGLGRLEEAIEILSSLPTRATHALLLLASARALAGQHDQAEQALEQARAQLDPEVWGVQRAFALVEALVSLQRASGTDRWLAACAEARSVLDAGVLVLCEDGQRRERPGEVARARILLEDALERGAR